MTTLRPRLDVTCVMADGRRFDVFTTVRDHMALKAAVKQLVGDTEDVCHLAYFAAVRTGRYEGTWTQWLDDLEDFEANEPPPLRGEEPSPDSSPQWLETLGSHPGSLPV